MSNASLPIRRHRARRAPHQLVGVLCVLAVVVAAVFSPDQSGAQESKDTYEAVLAESLAVLERYEAAVNRTAELEAELADIDSKAVSLQVELDDAQRRVDETAAVLTQAEADLVEIEKKRDREVQRLRNEAVAAYMGAGKPVPDLGAAMRDPRALDDFARGRVYADVVVTDRRLIIDEVTELRKGADQLREEAEMARDMAVSARDEVTAREAELERIRNDRIQAEEAARRAATHEQELAVQLEARRRDAELSYSQDILTSDSIGAILAERQRGQDPPATSLGIFLNPIKNGRIVSPYGARIDPFLGTASIHAALDIDAVMGEPVRASEAGTVVIASEQGGYGLAVVIDHGNTLATLCGHMSAFTVKPGDIVERGQIVGLAGSTGRSTGPHCHWEVRINGVRVDGRAYLDRTPEL